MKVRVTKIRGTVAKPSKPSVKFTALEDPIITMAAKGNRNIRYQKLNFYNMEYLTKIFVHFELK